MTRSGITKYRERTPGGSLSGEPDVECTMKRNVSAVPDSLYPWNPEVGFDFQV